MSYWFNVDTKQVETDENRSQDANVLGPYDTHEAAAGALQHVRDNNDEWDAEDKAWEGRGAAPGWDDSDVED